MATGIEFYGPSSGSTSGVFNVVDYGALGDYLDPRWGTPDSVTTTTTAIQNAIDDAGINGKVVFPGTVNGRNAVYLTNATLTVTDQGQVWEGEGIPTIRLQQGFTGNVIHLDHAWYFTMRDMIIQAGSSSPNNNGHGIYCEEAAWLHMERVRVYSVQKSPIYSELACCQYFEDCLFYGNGSTAGTYAVHLGMPTSSGNTTNQITFNHCRIVAGVGGHGVCHNENSGVSVDYIGCDFATDDMSGSSIGLDIQAGANIRVASYFEGFGWAIKIGSYATVTNVEIRGCYFAVNSDNWIGIDVHKVQGLEIENNLFLVAVGPYTGCDCIKIAALSEAGSWIKQVHIGKLNINGVSGSNSVYDLNNRCSIVGNECVNEWTSYPPYFTVANVTPNSTAASSVLKVGTGKYYGSNANPKVLDLSFEGTKELAKISVSDTEADVDGGAMSFYTSVTAGSLIERLRIDRDGTTNCLGRLLVRTLMSDPKHVTPGSRPAGSVPEIAYYSGKLYLCTNASTPTWELISSS